MPEVSGWHVVVELQSRLDAQALTQTSPSEVVPALSAEQQ